MKTLPKGTGVNLKAIEKEKRFIIYYLILTLVPIAALLGNQSKLSEAILIAYGFGTQVYLYFFRIRALRNMKIFWMWFVVGLLHLIIFSIYITLKPKEIDGLFAANTLKNTVPLLILYQLLRAFTKLSTNKELVMVSRTGYDIDDKRKNTWADILCYFIYFAAAIILSFVNYPI